MPFYMPSICLLNLINIFTPQRKTELGSRFQFHSLSVSAMFVWMLVTIYFCCSLICSESGMVISIYFPRTLKNMVVAFASCHLCWRLGHFKSSIILTTLLFYAQLFITTQCKKVVSVQRKASKVGKQRQKYWPCHHLSTASLIEAMNWELLEWKPGGDLKLKELVSSDPHSSTG